MRLLLACLLLLCAAPLAAQQRGGFPLPDTAGAPLADTLAKKRHRPEVRLLARTAAGAGTWPIGAFVGAYAGLLLLPHDCGGCDDPGLGAAITGAVAGGLLVSSIFAAAPDMGDRCGYRSRFGWAFLGGAAGTVLGIFLADRDDVITIPFGTVLGSAAGTLACRPAY